MNLAENDRHVKTEMKTKKVLNIFSSNNYLIFDPTLKALVKYKSTQVFLPFNLILKARINFFFIKITTLDIKSEIVFVYNVDVFADILCISQ